MIDLNFIKQWEGCRLRAYKPLPNDKWTIGYGATGPGIEQGTVWTQQQAEDDLVGRTEAMESALIHAVDPIQLTKGQRTALVSLAYNIGLGALFTSSLFRLLHKNCAKNVVAAEFSRWAYSNGMRVPGLIHRRDSEKKLFLEEA